MKIVSPLLVEFRESSFESRLKLNASKKKYYQTKGWLVYEENIPNLFPELIISVTTKSCKCKNIQWHEWTMELTKYIVLDTIGDNEK